MLNFQSPWQRVAILSPETGANLAHIQAENVQNIQKYIFGKKTPGVNGLKTKVMKFLQSNYYSLFFPIFQFHEIHFFLRRTTSWAIL